MSCWYTEYSEYSAFCPGLPLTCSEAAGSFVLFDLVWPCAVAALSGAQKVRCRMVCLLRALVWRLIKCGDHRLLQKHLAQLVLKNKANWGSRQTDKKTGWLYAD